jgi:peroxiredoxin
VFGREVRVPEGLDAGPLVLCFVRYLGCSFCRESLAELQEAFPDFDRAGARVVAVTRTPMRTARDFVPRHHLLFPVVADPEGSLEERFHIGRDRDLMCTIKGLPETDIGRTLRALRRGHGPFEGPERQLAAEFVIGRDGCFSYTRYACSILAGPDIPALLQTVSDEV